MPNRTIPSYHAPGLLPFTLTDADNGGAVTKAGYGWPWVASTNVLLAHAAGVARYRSKYQKTQGGIIGITNNQDWRVGFLQSTISD